MSLFGSLSTGVAGLSAQSEAISVISDNLANVNTTGYKASSALFNQLVTTAGVSGVAFNSGGVQTEVLSNQNVQGSLSATDNATDLALSGNGFFVLATDRNITSDTSFFYSRDGAFREDSRGFLSHPSGNFLMGWRTESNGEIIDRQNPQPIELQTVGASARATQSLELGLNLTSTEEAHIYSGANLLASLDAIVADPNDADFVIDDRFFDAQGGARDVSVAFVKRSQNLWDYVVYTDGANIEGGTSGISTRIHNGTVRFNENGTLNSVTGEQFTVDWSGGVPPGEITMDFGDYTGTELESGPINGFVTLPTAAAHVNPDATMDNGVRDVYIDYTDATYQGIAPAPGSTWSIAYNAGTQQIELHNAADAAFGAASAIAGPVNITAGATTAVDFGNGVKVTVDQAALAAAGTGFNFDINIQAQKDTGVGTNGVIQFASAYNTLFSTQDGFGSGTLSAVQVDDDGFVIGSFTNGETKKLYKLQIGVFQDPNSLAAISGNIFQETDGSGRVLFKEAGIGNTATVKSGALESSTVDIASEFSNLIISQRAYQSSSKIVSTVDQMLNELLGLR